MRTARDRPSSRALRSDTKIVAAAPSTFAEHISLVSGQAIISLASTTSSGVSIWYIALEFMVAWWWFFTATWANCSIVVP